MKHAPSGDSQNAPLQSLTTSFYAAPRWKNM